MAFASPLLKDERSGQDSQPYVWAHSEGSELGIALEPLYKSLPDACLNDSVLYKALSALDAVRIGTARERKLAEKKMLSFLEHPE